MVMEVKKNDKRNNLVEELFESKCIKGLKFHGQFVSTNSLQSKLYAIQ